jgi:hypothetical protein
MVSALWLHGVLAVSYRFCRNEKGRHENGGLRNNYWQELSRALYRVVPRVDSPGCRSDPARQSARWRRRAYQ